MAGAGERRDQQLLAAAQRSQAKNSRMLTMRRESPECAVTVYCAIIPTMKGAVLIRVSALSIVGEARLLQTNPIKATWICGSSVGQIQHLTVSTIGLNRRPSYIAHGILVFQDIIGTGLGRDGKAEG